MRCNFPIVYGLKTTFTRLQIFRSSTDENDLLVTLVLSNKQYGPKLGIFNLYQIVCIGQPSAALALSRLGFKRPALEGRTELIACYISCRWFLSFKMVFSKANFFPSSIRRLNKIRRLKLFM